MPPPVIVVPPIALETAGNLLRSPAFWTALIHSANVAVERASPDYTQAHHIAATLERMFGNATISTPTAKDVIPVPQAVVEAVKGVAPAVAAAVEQAVKK